MAPVCPREPGGSTRPACFPWAPPPWHQLWLDCARLLSRVLTSSGETGRPSASGPHGPCMRPGLLCRGRQWIVTGKLGSLLRPFLREKPGSLYTAVARRRDRVVALRPLLPAMSHAHVLQSRPGMSLPRRLALPVEQSGGRGFLPPESRSRSPGGDTGPSPPSEKLPMGQGPRGALHVPVQPDGRGPLEFTHNYSGNTDVSVECAY